MSYFGSLGQKGLKRSRPYGIFEIFEKKKNWEFLSHSKQEKAIKIFEIFFGSFLTLTLSKNRKKLQKHTFWTPNPSWVIWFGCKWSKTVPIMVEYHRPPFSHVEICPRRVRRCSEGAQCGRKCPKSDFLDYWSNLYRSISLQMFYKGSYYGRVPLATIHACGNWAHNGQKVPNMAENDLKLTF